MSKRIIWPNGSTSALTITFDDGYADTYEETAVWLAERGMGATYYVVSRCVGKDFENKPTATWENWHNASSLGHEIASHSATHASMAGFFSEIGPVLGGILAAPDRGGQFRQIILRAYALMKHRYSKDGIRDELDPLMEPAISRQEIIGKLPECPVLSFSYPAGRVNPAARQAVVAAGYHSARGNQAGINLDKNSLFALRSLCLGPGLERQDLEPWLLRSIHQNGWLILTFHLVSKNNPTQYPYYCSVADFQRIVDRIQELPFWVANQQSVIEYLGKREP
jgi:peptidoglycan/xylan/chitin deacetylase (PgdA/CDA1 family)